MKIIISPAKKMKKCSEFDYTKMPEMLNKTKLLKKAMQSLSYEQCKSLWACSDKIAQDSMEMFAQMNLTKHLVPALIAYEGIQYQYLAPQAFLDAEWQYIQEHLRILSGFYGILKPLDGIVPYRLEMKSNIQIGTHTDLYAFWGKHIYASLFKETECVVNLASKEYSQVIEKYLKPKDRWVNITFNTCDKGKYITKATFAKMARGEMVRFMAEEKIEDLEELKKFNRQGFTYSEALSTKDNWVFVK